MAPRDPFDAAALPARRATCKELWIGTLDPRLAPPGGRFLTLREGHRILGQPFGPSRGSGWLGDCAMTCPRCQQDTPAHARFCLGAVSALPSMRSAWRRVARGCALLPARRSRGHRDGGGAEDARTPQTYTPKHLAESDPHLETRPGRRAEAGRGSVRRPQGLLGAARRPRSRRARDGVMASFGAPLAHGGHSVRARYAALRPGGGGS